MVSSPSDAIIDRLLTLNKHAIEKERWTTADIALQAATHISLLEAELSTHRARAKRIDDEVARGLQSKPWINKESGHPGGLF